MTCPDQVFYYHSWMPNFISFNTSMYTNTTLGPLPNFVTFQPFQNNYVFNINSLIHVGTYRITL
jgi:hypothetical protein